MRPWPTIVGRPGLRIVGLACFMSLRRFEKVKQRTVDGVYSVYSIDYASEES
jgi:hypothetical protein